MNALSIRGLTMLEIMVLIAILGVLSFLLIPTLGSNKRSSQRTNCARNLKCLGYALQLYADVPANKVYPQFGGTPGSGATNARLALTKLFNAYICDYRILSCPSAPTLPALQTLSPYNNTDDKVGAIPLSVATSGYGYDQRHGPQHMLAAIMSDTPNGGLNKAAGTPNNHGENGGQNVLLGSGSVEFNTDVSRIVGDGRVDPSIFKDDVGPINIEEDGFIE
jgi:type II secretory pathway pseudopilin PulG